MVLQNISFHISEGEKVGIIGLNGAGKTTLLNVIAGLIKVDSGFLRVHRVEDTLKDYTTLREMVYVSGTKPLLWEDLTVKASLENCISMYKIPKKEARERLTKLTEIFAIEGFLEEIPRNLSLGERMRCELTYAMLIEPKVFLLDEAMIGLDVSMKYKIMQYLKEYCMSKKTTMLYTSHNLTEVEKLCDRIILIDKGKIIYDGSIDRIMYEYSPLYHLEIKISGNLPDFEDLPIQKISLEKDVIHLVYDQKKIETAQILKHIMERSKIEDVRLFEPDLEGTIKKICERRK